MLQVQPFCKRLALYRKSRQEWPTERQTQVHILNLSEHGLLLQRGEVFCLVVFKGGGGTHIVEGVDINAPL